MRAYFQKQTDMAARVRQFIADNPMVLEIPRAVTLQAEVDTVSAAMLTHGAFQVNGRGGYRAGATERKSLAADLRTFLADMAATARGLEPQFPGMADQFRLGRQSDSFQRLISTANAFLLAVAEPGVKELFTARAFPEDFDVQVREKIVALQRAVGRKAAGLQTQMEGTAGLKLLSVRLTIAMQELRALMVKYLRDRDPVLLEVWNAAARVYSQPAAAVKADEVVRAAEEAAEPVADEIAEEVARRGAKVETLSSPKLESLGKGALSLVEAEPGQHPRPECGSAEMSKPRVVARSSLNPGLQALKPSALGASL